jgi:4,5-dihydroxyphthalate decarboxylase
MTPLVAAIGRYKHTEALFEDPLLRIETFPVINRAFAPMVRAQRFDISEMAIATFLMARAAGSDLVLLPVVLAARFQNGAFLRRAAHEFGPGDLKGRRIGVRAYSQTTGLWVRGSLQEEYGLRPNEVCWVTFEGAHVAFRDPAWVERAPPASEMLGMLRAGSLDAAIFGNHVPFATDLATVFPAPTAAGRSFLARHGFMQSTTWSSSALRSRVGKVWSVSCSSGFARPEIRSRSAAPSSIRPLRWRSAMRWSRVFWSDHCRWTTCGPGCLPTGKAREQDRNHRLWQSGRDFPPDLATSAG